MTYQVSFRQKVGYEQYILQQFEKQDRRGLSDRQIKEYANQMEQQETLLIKIIRYAIVSTYIIITFLVGGILYWLGAIFSGGSAATPSKGIAVWVYSSLPPSLILGVSNIIVLLLKPANEIDFVRDQWGIIKVNPTFLFYDRVSPVYITLLTSLDIFYIWGILLAVIGCHITNKTSKLASLGIVLIVALISLSIKCLFAHLFGKPL